jgi:prepilin signal peptidase PulO-like enzyme (type II secretory pathway)
MVGAFIGWEKSLLVFMLSPFIALPYALFFRFVKKNETIPYGPFLAVMAVILFLKGDELIRLYLKLYGA